MKYGDRGRRQACLAPRSWANRLTGASVPASARVGDVRRVTSKRRQLLRHGAHLRRRLGQDARPVDRKSRHPREVVVLGKGRAHAELQPGAVTRAQLCESLEQHAAPTTSTSTCCTATTRKMPVGEFVDVLNEHSRRGPHSRVRRVELAIDARSGRQRLCQVTRACGASVAVSNNFSLARMVDPLWDGCIARSDRRIAHGSKDAIAAAAVVEPGARVLRARATPPIRYPTRSLAALLVQPRTTSSGLPARRSLPPRRASSRSA